jgi:prepilin-type N-terminal cleavage/methylation domain-containing protein
MNARGFTLLEITIVLVVIGILSFAVLKGTGLVGNANVKDLIAVSQDMSVAVREFKQRYRMYPGDLAIAAATPEIASVSAKCVTGGPNAGNNNGVIEASESVCVPEVLFRSGLIGKSLIDAGGNYTISTSFGNATVVAASVSGLAMPTGVQNVLIVSNLPCDAALQLDQALDDGKLGSGKVVASVASCTPGGANDPVPLLGVGL